MRLGCNPGLGPLVIKSFMRQDPVCDPNRITWIIHISGGQKQEVTHAGDGRIVAASDNACLFAGVDEVTLRR